MDLSFLPDVIKILLVIMTIGLVVYIQKNSSDSGSDPWVIQTALVDSGMVMVGATEVTNK